MTAFHRGLLFALAAYAMWGVMPLYFWKLRHVSGLEIVAHRVVWASLMLVGGLLVLRRIDGIREVFRDRRKLGWLAVSSALILTNWLTFVYANVTGQVAEGSLGYFLNPLVNVVLGMVVLGERLKRNETAAVTLAAIGVGVLIVFGGKLPWIALTLAFSFSVYTLVRKQVVVDPAIGLAIECLLLFPIALFGVSWWQAQGSSAFLNYDPMTDWLLVAAGITTILPLVCFAAGVKHLPMKTIGFLQYFCPTVQLLLAVLVLGESLEPPRLAGFICIWVAVAVYSAGLFASDDQSASEEPAELTESPASG